MTTPEFYKKRKLVFHLERIYNANSDLLSVLTINKAVYHHNCFSKCSDSTLKRFNEPSKKRKSTEDKNGRKSARVQLNRGKDSIYSAAGVVKRR